MTLRQALALTRIRRAGLLKGRGTQRTDSTHILSAARELTRLELVTEAVRAVLEAMAHQAPEVLDELPPGVFAREVGHGRGRGPGGGRSRRWRGTCRRSGFGASLLPPLLGWQSALARS